MNTARSKQLLERARKVIPGGVNSPVRAFGSVGGQARFIRSASGARIEDEDGNTTGAGTECMANIIIGVTYIGGNDCLTFIQ